MTHAVVNEKENLSPQSPLFKSQSRLMKSLSPEDC